MRFQFDITHTYADGKQDGDIVGPMGEFYGTLNFASPKFIEHMLNALDFFPATTAPKDAS